MEHTAAQAEQVVELPPLFSTAILSLVALRFEAAQLRKQAIEHGCEHGPDEKFWDLVVRATSDDNAARACALGCEK
jgi:hypothetical protein